MFHPDGPSLLDLTRQALSSTERGYDLLAPKFDATPFRTPDDLLDAVAPHLADRPVARALDSCTGTGAGLRPLRPLCTDELVGADWSEGMLRVAAARVGALPGDTPVRLVRMDARESTFDNEFDLITCWGALGHFVGDDQDRVVDGWRRALGRGGRVAIVTAPNPPVWSPIWWAARGFNAAMHVRNALIRPPFVMFYLQFGVDRAAELFQRHGLRTSVSEAPLPRPYGRLRLVFGRRDV